MATASSCGDAFKIASTHLRAARAHELFAPSLEVLGLACLPWLAALSNDELELVSISRDYISPAALTPDDARLVHVPPDCADAERLSSPLPRRRRTMHGLSTSRPAAPTSNDARRVYMSRPAAPTLDDVRLRSVQSRTTFCPAHGSPQRPARQIARPAVLLALSGSHLFLAFHRIVPHILLRVFRERTLEQRSAGEHRYRIRSNITIYAFYTSTGGRP